jgi:hypothetical protein
MSDVTINPALRQPVVSDPAVPSPKTTPPPATSASATAPATASRTDTVQLSAAAQTVLATSTRPVLTEAQAAQTSGDLRQQLGARPLSGSAKQNQAILSLLR